MGKPVLTITVISGDKKKKTIPALFDTGSHYSIIRSDCVPSARTVIRFPLIKTLGTASKTGGVRIVGETGLIMTIGRRRINDRVLVSPDLKREMVIGADTMQGWDITIKNRNGKTRVSVGHDMRDPDIIEVA
ncbi:MAG: hypothetical protein HYT87_13675 [Nitrospirae bacterium]|nr:hypothetical protein [Nitrospirota bacterium]